MYRQQLFAYLLNVLEALLRVNALEVTDTHGNATIARNVFILVDNDIFDVITFVAEAEKGVRHTYNDA